MGPAPRHHRGPWSPMGSAMAAAIPWPHRAPQVSSYAVVPSCAALGTAKDALFWILEGYKQRESEATAQERLVRKHARTQSRLISLRDGRHVTKAMMRACPPLQREVS